MNSPVVYSYKGSEISFMNSDSVMINATQMAKPFSKSPKDFLKTEQTKTAVAPVNQVKSNMNHSPIEARSTSNTIIEQNRVSYSVA